MRELFRKNTREKRKRIVAGVIAVVLAVMAAIPMNFPVVEANAEENIKNSIQIVSGELKSITYTILVKEGEKEKKYTHTVENIDKDKYEFSEERVIDVTVQYEMNSDYILESVMQDGVALEEDQYTVNSDGTVTYDAGDENNIGHITIRCIPKELKVSNLEAERAIDNEGVPTNSVKLSWETPDISEEAYSLKEYRLIIKREVNGTEDIVCNIPYETEDGTQTSAYEDMGVMNDAVSTTANYTVSVVANKAYNPDSADPFYGEGKVVDWSAVYDMQLAVTGNGSVKIGEKDYISSNTPYMIYNIPYVEEDKTNFEMKITPENEYGVSSLLIDGSEAKQEIDDEDTYKTRLEKNGNLSINFAPLAATPAVTTSGDVYTEIAENGIVEITSAENVEKTSYGYQGLKNAEKQKKWEEFPQFFEGASTTVEISAKKLFEGENYAVLRAYSSQSGYADSKIAEQYYYCRPEMPALTSVSFENNYALGQWASESVTLNYVDNSSREYAGVQLGYTVNGQSEMKWQDMNQQDNTYSYAFNQSGEYSIALRFKMADPNHAGEFVYGDALILASTVKVDMENPGLDVSGYTSDTWSREDVTLNLHNPANQISGTSYQYIVSEHPVTDMNQLKWEDCKNGNQVIVTCEDGKSKTQYVYMKAVSNAGKESGIVPYCVMIDKEKPAVPQVSFQQPDGENEWYKTLPVIAMEQVCQDEGSQMVTCYKLYQEGQNPDTIPETIFDGTNQPAILADGKYILTYYARDAVGNTSEMTEQQFKVDTGAPNGPAIEFRTENDSVLAHIINFITFGYFCNEKVVAVVQSSDSMSQVKEYGVWYTQNGKDSEVSIVQGATAELELPENFEGTVSAYAVDNAGNQSETTVSDGIIYESTQSEITITTDIDNSKWQKKDISFHVVTQDTQSGLQKVEYSLNGKTIYQNNFTDSEYNDPVYMDQQDIQATEEAENDAGYTLLVKVTDNAGNQSEKSAVVYIDKTAPVVEFAGIENGTSSNDTENLTVKVKEQIYNLNQVTVSATRTIDGVTSDYEMEAFVSDNINAKKNYAFSEDGLYVVTVSAIDAAGNTAVSKQISFRIDKTAPKITLAGPQNDSYHASDVPVEVNVEESFFDTNSVTINVTKTIDGQTANVEFGKWNNEGKNSSLARSFQEDGTYQIEVQAKDAAGNQAVSQPLVFTVDKTAPEVSINGAGDYLITGNTITLSYDVVESYFDTNNVSIQMQKEDTDGSVAEVSVGNWVSSGKESSLSYELNEDGVYTSTITAVDKAGNEAIARKTVTVDTSDPVIKHVDDMNGKYYQVFKLPYELNEMIADLTVPDVTMYLNSDEYDGISEVTEEGKYVFKMDVSDEVGHKAVAQAEFIVDNTEPKVMFNGVEDGMKSDKDIEWSVSLADAKDTLKEVKVDGETKKINQKRNAYQSILSKKGTHTIEVSAEDLAGNITKEAISVTISEESVLPAWTANKLFVAGGVVAVAGAASVGVGYAAGMFKKGTGKRVFKKKFKK